MQLSWKTAMYAKDKCQLGILLLDLIMAFQLGPSLLQVLCQPLQSRAGNSLVPRLSNNVGAGKSLVTTTLHMRQKFPDFWEFVISLYSSIRDDVKLASQWLFATMVVSVLCSSSPQNFESGLCYALSQLCMTIRPVAEERAEASNLHDLWPMATLSLVTSCENTGDFVLSNTFPTQST